MNYFHRIITIILQFIKYLFILAATILVLLAIFLSNVYSDFQQATKNTLAGKNNLSIAIEAAKGEDWNLALTKSNQAQTEFNLALNNISSARTNPLIKRNSILRTQVNNLEYLVKTGEIISRSLKHSISLAQKMTTILSGSVSRNFSDLSSDEKSQFIELIYKSGPDLIGLKANLELAVLNLKRIPKFSLLFPVYGQINKSEKQLDQAISLIGKVIPFTKLLPALSGYPQTSKFLIVFQNNDELRPSGGFIGLYGILDIKNGEITNLQASDSYHLDMPALGKWKEEPPAPLKRYLKVKNWYLRDANWSPNWPTAAQQIEKIYNGEKLAVGEPSSKFVGVIAINPDFVADLISLVGPIVVQNETYTPNNFQKLLQYEVEVAYKEEAISAWDRKEVVNDLISKLKKRLFKLPANRWPEILKVIDTNIAERNIQIYFHNDNLEALAKNLGVGGEIQNPPSDYLMVVDANLGAFKSDAVIKKNISYNVSQTTKGAEAQLALNYTHEGSFDWRTTRYRSYTRVYTPLGSKLVTIKGLDKTKADFSVQDDAKLNKTIFAFFWKIEPKKSNTVILNYRLPPRIVSDLQTGKYSLLVQKQSGQKGVNLEVGINFNNKVKNWYTNLKSDNYFH